LKHFLVFFIGIALVIAISLRVRYGGGEPYADVSGSPVLPEVVLETVLGYPEPVGNVAVSKEGRVFFTVHPESRPQGNKLLEWVDGAAVPYPDGAAQPKLFNTPLGIVVDSRNRLWTIDHGNHGFSTPRLIAIDLDNARVVLDIEFPREVTPVGSFLQDLQITSDGNHVFIADASIWRKTPAIVVFDVRARTAHRALESHPSVSAMDFLVRTPSRDMSFLGGLVSLKAGIDGLALSADDEWLYYGALNHDGLFRVPVSLLKNASSPTHELAASVERYSDKPLSDGISADNQGNVYITDVEHGAIHQVTPARKLQTLVRSNRIRWADDLSFGPDGWLYLADSAIPELVLRSKDHIRAEGPYYIYRFQPVPYDIIGK